MIGVSKTCAIMGEGDALGPMTNTFQSQPKPDARQPARTVRRAPGGLRPWFRAMAAHLSGGFARNFS